MGDRSEWVQDNPSKKTAYMRSYTRNQTQEWKDKRNEYARQWRLNNKDKFKASQKRAYDNMRLDVLQHYSDNEVPECACCGESEILFLHLDHINGDGADHRRELESELGYYPGGNNLPYWLKKNNYPGGFQVLCANCNLGKRLNMYCPHQKGDTL